MAGENEEGWCKKGSQGEGKICGLFISVRVFNVVGSRKGVGEGAFKKEGKRINTSKS